MIVIPESSAHWYDSKTYSPRHDADLRAARKEGLFPSPTSVLKCLHKPSLTAWLQQQAILSSLTLPRASGEQDDAFAKRVVNDMGETSRKATDFGTRIHKLKQNIHRQNYFDANLDSDWEYVLEYEKEFSAKYAQVVHSEKILVNHKLGYAGTCDLVAEHREWGMILQDTKTQNIKEKPVFYPEWPMQLVAYAECLDYPVKIVSCIINSAKPDIPYFKVWDNYDQAWNGFKGCLELWRYTNKFYV